jgi:hypothetical protein
MNQHPNKDLFDAYDENWHKLFFDTQTMGYLVAHKKHGLREFPQNMQVGLRLARMGECVELLPDTPQVPSVDATRNNEVWEIKMTNGTANSVQKRLTKGKTQSKCILLVLPEFFEDADLLRGIISAINNDKDKNIEKIDLLFFDDRLVQLNRYDIQKRDFKKYWALILG